MKANVLTSGYAPAKASTYLQVMNRLATAKARVTAQVKKLLAAMGCPIETAADAHYVKCTLACLLSPICPPLLAVAAYQLYQAQTKKGGTI